MDYSPGKGKELDTTEQVSTSTSDEKPVLNYMTFWKNQNYEGSKKISDFQGIGGGDKQAEYIVFFRAVKILCTCTYYKMMQTLYGLFF